MIDVHDYPSKLVEDTDHTAEMANVSFYEPEPSDTEASDDTESGKFVCYILYIHCGSAKFYICAKHCCIGKCQVKVNSEHGYFQYQLARLVSLETTLLLIFKVRY